LKVLLVYPRIPDTFWNLRYALKFINKKANFPPLGLLTVGAMLPKKWNKRLIDLNVTELREKDLEWADFAFVSAMLVQRHSARQVVSRCKDGGLKVVAGGPLFTGGREGFDDVDHFVLNEAELTLPAFLRDLEGGFVRHVYETKEFCDIRKSPVPAWELADFRQYDRMCIQSSRGCPFDCEFCDITAMLGHEPRLKSSEQVIFELDSLYDRGWRGGIFFVDDNFIGNKGYLKKQMLPALIEWRKDKLGVPFYTQATANLADDQDLLEMMVNAGFEEVFIGIETPEEKSLAECNKRINEKRNLLQSVKKLHHAGLQVQGGFIIGFDNDTEDTFKRQIDFIQESGIVAAMVGLLQAFPGTRLEERLRSEGRLVGVSSGDNVDGTTNIIPKMGLDFLRQEYGKLIQFIYSPEQYYARLKRFMQDIKKPGNHVPPDLERIRAFFRSVIRIGILGKERFYYWKILTWTLARRPGLFRHAVALAIYGYHFRRISESLTLSDTKGPDRSNAVFRGKPNLIEAK
jgi:radical SAM superfamily enzyme YgiQ (UPF0313 family)